MFYIAAHHHPLLVLILRERKYSSLEKVYIDAKEIENNLGACGNLSYQILVEDLQTHKLKEEYGQQEYSPSLQLFQHVGASFAYFNSFSDLESIKSYFDTIENVDVCVHKLHQQDEFTYTVEYFPNHENEVYFVYEDDHEGHFTDDDFPYGKFLADHSRNIFNPTIKMSHDNFVKEEVVSPKCLSIHIANQQPFFVYDNMEYYMFLNFGHDITL